MEQEPSSETRSEKTATNYEKINDDKNSIHYKRQNETKDISYKHGK